MRSMVSWTASLLLAWSWVTPAGSAPMEHHDLASLWFMADHVIRAEVVAQQARHEPWNTTTTYRVTHVYGGALVVGDEVEVYDDAYRTEIPPSWDWIEPDHPVERMPPPADPEQVLFLAAAPPRLIREGLLDGEGLFQKVPSGQRLLAGGRVYRVEQQSNPGAYAPVPQWVDPDDVFGLVPGWEMEPLTLTAFERELAEAQQRAEAAAAALAIPVTEERIAALLQLLPPPATFPPPSRFPAGGFAADGLSRHLQDAIASTGDLDALVEAFGRDVLPTMRGFDARGFLDPDPAAGVAALLAVATDRHRPRHHRHAALRLLAENRHALRDRGGEAVDLLGGLLDDPDPWVRQTAVQTLARYAHGDHREAVVGRLVDHATAERNPEVLIAAGRQLAALDAKIARLDPLLGDGKELVLAVRPAAGRAPAAGEVLLGHGYLIQHHDWSPAVTLRALAVDGEGKRLESASTHLLAASHGQDGGHGVAAYTFEPPLEPGGWQFSLIARVTPTEIDRPVLEVSSSPLAMLVP